MKRLVCLLLAAVMVVILCIPAFAKENMGDNSSPLPGGNSTFSAPIEAPADKSGSTLSEGSLTIIVGFACAVVFGLGGFFIGRAAEKKKKKKPALASGENTDEE